jgi:5-methylcytosine-specific restriction endonuclease McrA
VATAAEKLVDQPSEKSIMNPVEHDPQKSVTGRLHAKTPRRQKIKAKIRHAVSLRDRGQCTATRPDGQRCAKRRWLDIHHLKPHSQGGTDQLENLQTLCSAHHRLQHWVGEHGL